MPIILTIYDTVVPEKVRDNGARMKRICSYVDILFLLYKILSKKAENLLQNISINWKTNGRSKENIISRNFAHYFL